MAAGFGRKQETTSTAQQSGKLQSTLRHVTCRRWERGNQCSWACGCGRLHGEARPTIKALITEARGVRFISQGAMLTSHKVRLTWRRREGTRLLQGIRSNLYSTQALGKVTVLCSFKPNSDDKMKMFVGK